MVGIYFGPGAILIVHMRKKKFSVCKSCYSSTTIANTADVLFVVKL